MFLNTTKRRNPGLIQAGVRLHQDGQIPPNTYVIDVDMLEKNVRRLAQTAEQYGIELYFMSKQLGRLPELARMIRDNGISKAVAVEFEEARVLAEAGIDIGHVGHLVQPGKSQWDEVLNWRPEVVTVFSVERAKQVSNAAKRLGIRQPVLVKVVDDGDMIYPGQEGGFALDSLADVLPELTTMPGIRIVGVTAFPVFRLADNHESMEPTKNMGTLLKGKALLEKAGVEVIQVNGPSATSCRTIPQLAEAGITHGEPGHALTGTTPLHAYQDLPEKPAMIYVTEVSHTFRDRYYAIGGGAYARSNVEGVLVGNSEDDILDRFVKVPSFPADNIDYYLPLEKPDGFHINVGDTAVYAFRTQIFVTRANVALVAGIQDGEPTLIDLKRRW